MIEIKQIPSEYKIVWCVWKRPYQRLIAYWENCNELE